MADIVVSAAPSPFSNLRVVSGAELGSSIADIVGQQVHPRYMGKVDIVVSINGNPVFPKYWHRIRPKAGTVVSLRVVPMGGGGGRSKNPLSTVLSIAVMVAAPYFAGALAWNLAPFLGGITSSALALSRGILTVGFSVLGSMAVRALVPPPKPSNATGLISNPAESPTQFIEGANNALQPFGVVPVCLGTNRMVPPQAAKAYTETQDNDNYVRQLFTWGYGQKLTVTDLKIGETDISAFSDIEIAHKLDGNLNEGTNLFSNSVIQENANILLEEPAGFTVRAVAVNSNEAILDVTWPQGLMGIVNTTGQRFALTIGFELQYSPAGMGDWTPVSIAPVTATQQEAVVRSFRVVFPSAGNYDIRIRRTTPAFADSFHTYFQQTFLTAIRGVRYVNPVTAAGINGTAIRIRATDQLNGSIDQLNGVVSNHIPDYDADTDSWIERQTSNPASIYRYILQGYPNARRLPDNKIRIQDLEEWHGYCAAKGYTYNRMIDYQTSVEDTLRDVATAGSATPANVDGKRTIVVDREKDDVVQIVTPRNSWDYTGEMTYPQMPHGFRVTFRNAAKGYLQDERIVYADGFDASNATLFETMEIQSCTNADLAWKAARRFLATAKLRPETHSWQMDVENLVAIRGDRIRLEHDVPMVGIGDGRIVEVVMDPPYNVVDDELNVTDDSYNVVDTPEDEDDMVVGLRLDDTITIPADGSYFVRIRLADGTQLYKQIEATVGDTTVLTFTEPFAPGPGQAEVGDLCYVVQGGGELDLIITRIEPGPDLTAKITAVDYAPGIFSSETGTIPTFNSNLTTPLEFIRPAAPVLLQAQVDESVLQQNPDGTFMSRAVFTFQNNNDGEVSMEVKIRPTGSTLFQNANVLESKPDRVVITGLTEGTRYDIHFRYRRAGGSIYSLPLQLNSLLYVGTGGPPADVTGYRLAALTDSIIHSWDPNEDIDFSHYRMRFSSLYSGVDWNTSQLIRDNIQTNQITLPFQGGTYLLKAVDLSGNESLNPAIVITYVPSVINAVEVLNEDPAFAGAKTNAEVVSSTLRLADPDIMEGLYEFDGTIDLGENYTSLVSSAIVANGVAIVDDSSFDLDIFAMDDIFQVPDLFGLSTGSWSIRLEFRYTTDDPDSSAAVWTEWDEFVAGSYYFRGMQFRLYLYSLQYGVSPSIAKLQITVDMPDRIERGNDLTLPDTGITITYTPAFKAPPAVTILLQDADEKDEIQFTSKDETGFTVRVYNTDSLTYVERVFDYVVSGYGRKEA